VTPEKAQKAMARQIDTGGGDIVTTGDIIDNIGISIGRHSHTEVEPDTGQAAGIAESRSAGWPIFAPDSSSRRSGRMAGRPKGD